MIPIGENMADIDETIAERLGIPDRIEFRATNTRCTAFIDLMASCLTSTTPKTMHELKQVTFDTMVGVPA